MEPFIDFHRRSRRLTGHDYLATGWYFVTICTFDRKEIFGEINRGRMYLNELGECVQTIWNELPQYYFGIRIDEYSIMPNHIHGIVWIGAPVGAGLCACPINQIDPSIYPNGQPQGVAPTGTMRISLPNVVHRFKSFTSTIYRKMHQKTKLWQRNYHERIIWRETELWAVRQYIRDNPKNWEQDAHHPCRITSS